MYASIYVSKESERERKIDALMESYEEINVMKD
jgi:hypothetical protein